MSIVQNINLYLFFGNDRDNIITFTNIQNVNVTLPEVFSSPSGQSIYLAAIPSSGYNTKLLFSFNAEGYEKKIVSAY